MGTKQTAYFLRSAVVLMLIAVICLTVTASLAQPDPSKASGAGVEVRFAVAEWPPLVTESRLDFGMVSGRISKIFSAMGLDARFEFLSWPRAIELTRRGEYVATFPWWQTSERSVEFHIPEFPVASSKHKGFYKLSRFPDGLEINDFGDVADLGLRPVVVASYWHKKEFAKLDIGVDVVANPESAWRFLNADRADILFDDEEPGWFDLTKTLGADVAKTYATTDIVPTSNLFILFSRHHPDGQKLRKAFDEFMASEEGQGIYEFWSIPPDGQKSLQDAMVALPVID